MSTFSNNATQLVFFLLLVHTICAVCSNWGVGDPKIRCIEAERQALLKFKENLNDSKGVLSSWGNEEAKRDCCKWLGVRCANETGHVLMLNLSTVDAFSYTHLLSGNISFSLNELQYLNYLDLTAIDFSGNLMPSFIGTLTKLRYLNLGYTYLSGEITSQLANLTNLEFLDLSGNSDLRLKNLGWLSRISSLRELVLSGTNMSEANDWLQIFHYLPYLTNLQLGYCDLPDIVPSSISLTNFSTTSLATLDLSANDIHSASVFKWLFKFTSSLVHLDLSNNRLEGCIPKYFGNMTLLEYLDFSKNQLKCSIPNSFGKITSLVHLDLSYNRLEGCIPKSFGNMTLLEYLDLSKNQLKCSIPNSFGNITSLAYLDLGNNMLEGEIPESIWNLCSLQTFSAEGNKLSGQLPNQSQPLFSCANYSLQYLNLASNGLTGSLPSHILVPSLKVLGLSSNLLNGSIPAESIGKLTELEELHISNNSIHGVISESHFSKLSKLWTLSLSDNSLVLNISADWNPPFQLNSISLRSCKLMSPQFPKWLQTQKEYLDLDMSNTGISDSIPSQFWNKLPTRSVFLHLNFSNNQISGILDNTSSLVTNHFSFVIIDLNSNELEGPIPSFLFRVGELHLSRNKFSKLKSLCDFVNGTITILNILDLSNNQLFGELPDCWWHFPNLKILNLANNKLSGIIPMSIGSSSELRTLHLENNSLNGELPSSLKNCTDLQVLNVGENKLSGKIPAWIGEDLQDLIILSLRSNHFHGSMPFHLCRLVDLQVLDLSLNYISGMVPWCLNNITALRTTHKNDLYQDKKIGYPAVIPYIYPDNVSFYEELQLQWKGTLSKYTSTLGLLKGIDLSGNKLMGEIPPTVTELNELVFLNLSRNNLSGQIPLEIGQLKSLDALDLSNNHFSGRIPSSLSKVDRLGVLDLSNNNLSGEIPTGTQLQSFDATSFMGNIELCGAPLPNKCPKEPTDEEIGDQKDENKILTKGFYVSLGVGFVLGFWGVCGSLTFIKSWRYRYFNFLNRINDFVYVRAMIHKAKLLRIIGG